MEQDAWLTKMHVWYSRYRPSTLSVIAGLIYILPIISFFLVLLDQITIQKTEMYLFLFGFVLFLPCGGIGSIVSIVEIVRSKRNGNTYRMLGGVLTLCIGIAEVIASIIGYMLIYAVVP